MADVQLSTLGSVIKTAYEGQANTNAFTDALLTKLNGVEALADVTDTANVTSSITGAALTAATVATDDKILIQDTDAGSAFKTVTASSVAALAKPVEAFILDVGDETTALTTGTAKKTFRMPYAFTLTAVRASVTTAPTGSTIIVDINENGATIMTTNKLSIDVSEKTSTTAAVPAGLTDTSLADDAEITIDIDQRGSSVAGAGLKVYLIGTRT